MNRRRLFLLALCFCNLSWAQTDKIPPAFNKAIAMAQQGSRWDDVLNELKEQCEAGHEPTLALYQLLVSEAYRQDEREVWNTLSQRKRKKEEEQGTPVCTPIQRVDDEPASTTRMLPRTGWMTDELPEPPAQPGYYDEEADRECERQLSFESASFAE